MKNPVPVLNNRLYDALAYLQRIALPAFGALYAGLSQVWGFPEPAKVVSTIVVICAFLGALLNLAAKAFNDSDAKFDGKINVVDTETKTLYDMEIHGDPSDIKDKDEVTFKVVHKRPSGEKKAAKKATRRRTATVELDESDGL